LVVIADFISSVKPDPHFECDRPIGAGWRIAVILLPFVLWVARWLASFRAGPVDRYYAEGISQFMGRAAARVAGVVPFSVAEVLFLVAVAWGVGSVARALHAVARRKRRVRNALVGEALRMGTAVSIVTALGFCAWGLNYVRPALAERMAWPPLDGSMTGEVDRESAAAELERLGEELVEETNRLYVLMYGVEDRKVPSGPPAEGLAATDEAVEHGYAVLTEQLKLHPHYAVSRGPAKPVVSSEVLSRLLVYGFYSPWTGEANYNRHAPGCMLPLVIAHEKAHQRSVALEDEANFLGYLACAHSGAPYARYAGCLFAQRQVLRQLQGIDPERAMALVQRRHAGVQRDVADIRAFRQSHSGTVGRVGMAVNHAYLKANRVEEGVVSYAMSVRLLVQFSRSNGGTCLVDSVRPDAPAASGPATGPQG
jgi:Protein of unknown function (DUF3810)